jgi:uncharacterized protein YfaS (alpha-2-macroglobulin family)
MEQSTSVTYPNVLILDYLKRTGKASPEARMKAEQFINLGYQRLLTFEVPGGGFDWFGEGPAKTVLSAYGLMHLVDMARVAPVDPALIDRTRALLLKRQQPDGAWPAEGVLHEDDLSGRDAATTATAYVTWALVRAGHADEAVIRALVYLEDRITADTDPYTLALAANAFAAARPQSAVTHRLLDQLEARKQSRGGASWWPVERRTVMYGSGDAATVEATALAAQAFLAADTHQDTATTALTYLVRQRSPNGVWSSTQATILALQALVGGAGGPTAGGSSTVTVQVNGRAAGTLPLTEKNADVSQQVDLTHYLQPGENRVALRLQGQARPLYQLVTRSYVPWHTRSAEPARAVEIRVQYDRTELHQNDTLLANVSIRSHHRESLAMLIADLGLAPGFAPDPASLAALQQSGRIERYEVTPRQLILYLRDLAPGAELRLPVRLRARFPVRAKTPPATVYEYYNPAHRAVTAPVMMGVKI